MKKTVKTMISMASAMLLSAIPFTGITASAFEINDVSMYMDFNRDGQYSVADLVKAVEFCNDGKLSTVDVENAAKLLLHEPVEIPFEEFDIDYMEVTPESMLNLQGLTTALCVDYEGDQSEEWVRYRFLNDGKVTEFRCSTFGTSEWVIGTPAFDGIQNVIGVSPEGHFVVDEYLSFDIPHQLQDYWQLDLDEASVDFAKYILSTSGKFENFEVYFPNENTTAVRFFFFNGMSRTEVNIERIAPVEEILREFIYEGERIAVGVTADGEIALDEDSFDLVAE